MNFHRYLVSLKMPCKLFLTIKQIVIRNKEGKPGKMHLSSYGQATATVANINADDHLELVNKDHVIAHVAAGGVSRY